jgi:hypothetical protein
MADPSPPRDEALFPLPEPAPAPTPKRSPRATRRGGRGFRLLTWGTGGVALGAGLAFLVLNIVARTERGHEFVLSQTLRALGGAIKGGQLQVERIRGGNLFEGAKLYGLRLVDREGRAFVEADSAFAEYDVVTLVSPRIVVKRLTLYQPRVWVFQLPGDSLWNYQRIFSDTVPRDPTRPRVERIAIFESARFVNGTVKVELPWQPDSTLSPRLRRAQLRAALSDTGTVVAREVPGRGYLRTINLTRVQGAMHDIRFAPGSVSGSRFHVDTLQADVQFFRRPARIEQMRGTAALLKDRFEFDAPELRLPGSLIAASGVVCINRDGDRCKRATPRGELPYYDIAFSSDSVAFRDLQWLYRGFPGDARGRLQLLVETRPEGTLFRVRDAALNTPRMRLSGNFGMVVGDTLRFTDVNVRGAPVHVPTIERMLPEGLPVRGLVLGGFEIRGNNAAPVQGQQEGEATEEEGGEASGEGAPAAERPERE